MLHRVVMIFILMLSFASFAEDTALKFYRPFGGADPLVIKKEIAGQCWQQSQRIKREDAWRCVAEGKVYDPCFVKQYGSKQEAVCPQSPWANENIQLKLSSPVDNRNHATLNMAEAYPWAVELMTGDQCLAIDEGEMQDELPMRYQCNNQTVLLGHMQRCKEKWSILQHSSKGVMTAFIAKAWF